LSLHPSVFHPAAYFCVRLFYASGFCPAGGGKSAGQALVLLANYGTIVNLVVRRPLAEAISNYLTSRIAALLNVVLYVGSEISELRGDKDNPIGVTSNGLDTGETSTCNMHFLFLFIGADPNSEWLGECDASRDRREFVMTGDALELDALNGAG